MGEQKDHYVSQTYLKQFVDGKHRLWVYNKKWPSVKSYHPVQVCKELGGSDNRYLNKKRAIEDFLNPLENGWKNVVEMFSNPQIEFDQYIIAKRIIASYMAYLAIWNPSASRFGQSSLAAMLKVTADKMYKAGMFPPLPASLKPHADCLFSASNFMVNPEFPKAMGAVNLNRMAEMFFKSRWVRFFSEGDEEFLTSDNPFCFLSTSRNETASRYLPLSPKCAVVFRVDFDSNKRDIYDHSEDGVRGATSEQVICFNEDIVKNAEKIVISNSHKESISSMVAAFKDWKMHNIITEIKSGNDSILVEKIVALKD